MEYISAKETDELWEVDPSRIDKIARIGRIEDAEIMGRNWLIPVNSEKMIDGITNTVKECSLYHLEISVFLLCDNFRKTALCCRYSLWK